MDARLSDLNRRLGRDFAIDVAYGVQADRLGIDVPSLPGRVSHGEFDKDLAKVVAPLGLQATPLTCDCQLCLDAEALYCGICNLHIYARETMRQGNWHPDSDGIVTITYMWAYGKVVLFSALHHHFTAHLSDQFRVLMRGPNNTPLWRKPQSQNEWRRLYSLLNTGSPF